jgi:hypothetical protein
VDQRAAIDAVSVQDIQDVPHEPGRGGTFHASNVGRVDALPAQEGGAGAAPMRMAYAKETMT